MTGEFGDDSRCPAVSNAEDECIYWAKRPEVDYEVFGGSSYAELHGAFLGFDRRRKSAIKCRC